MPQTEQYANLASTGLSGDINGVTGQLVVFPTTLYGSQPHAFPNVPQFEVRIDEEFIRVNLMSGHIWNVTRGTNNSTASGHTSGSTITHVLTRDSAIALGGQMNPYAAHAARPATGFVGRVFFPRDSLSIERESGGGWEPYGPVRRFNPPVNDQFAWTNQGVGPTGGIVVASGSMIYLSCPSSGAGGLRVRKKAAPGTPYTVTIGFIPMWSADSGFFPGMGLCLRQSGSGKLVTYSYTLATNAFIRTQKWTTETSFSAGYTNTTPNWEAISNFLTGQIVWQQVTDDGTNLKFRVSNDGIHWIQTFSVSRTDFLTVSGPDEVGIMVFTSGNYEASMTLLHWEES
jgi:hypothetical protein